MLQWCVSFHRNLRFSSLLKNCTTKETISSYILRKRIFRIRHFNHLSHSRSTPPPHDSPSENVLLYKLPSIRQFRFISRLKLYQVSTMLLLLPPVVYWYHLGEITTKVLSGAGIAALGTTAVLLVVSHYFRRAIGELVYCPHNATIRVSTITFMGGRRDLNFSVDKVVPFFDSQKRIGSAIQRLEVTNHPEVFLYSLRYGHVMDHDLMFQVLGIPDH